MPAIKLECKVRDPRFNELVAVSSVNREHNDCAVKAVAVATQTSYEEVLRRMTEFGRKSRRGTPMHVTDQVVHSLGYRMVRVHMMEMIAKYPMPHRAVLKTVTSHHPQRFNRVWTDGNTYLLRTARHILAIVNGVNVDWSKGQALRGHALYRIEKM